MTAAASIRHPVSGVLVPRTAVLVNGQQGLVYVVRADGRAYQRSVTLGAMDMNIAQVTSGLKAGERVVSGQLSGLSDGMPVRDLGSQ
jgi:hypothetical protein